MKSVYIVMNGANRVVGAFSTAERATAQVDLNARVVWGIDANKEPRDFDGALTHYGWAGKIWWQREVLYD